MCGVTVQTVLKASLSGLLFESNGSKDASKDVAPRSFLYKRSRNDAMRAAGGANGQLSKMTENSEKTQKERWMVMK